MPRTLRKHSYTNVYHVMLRGINKRQIFIEDSDRRKFINTLKNTKEKYECELYAYCLMDNHVHLLIFDSKGKLSNIIQSVAITYALYFNKKYDRVGHLFQNRYNSKCVESLEYLLNVVRYIHRNPEKAMIDVTDKYKWSSYNDYFETSKLINSQYILKLFDEDDIISKEKFKEFNLTYIDDYYDEIEYEFITNFTDEDATKIIKDKLNIDNLNQICNYNVKIRNQFIRRIKSLKGISKIQISRILNIDRKIVERA